MTLSDITPEASQAVSSETSSPSSASGEREAISSPTPEAELAPSETVQGANTSDDPSTTLLEAASERAEEISALNPQQERMMWQHANALLSMDIPAPTALQMSISMSLAQKHRIGGNAGALLQAQYHASRPQKTKTPEFLPRRGLSDWHTNAGA